MFSKTIFNITALIIGGLLFFSMSEAYAQTKIYKTVHADGSVTYSDLPSPGAIELDLSVPTNTMPSARVNSNNQQLTKPTNNVNYTINVLQPEDEATIRNNQGEITIAANISPRLNGIFQLTINGQVNESATGMFRLTDMDRGAYQYDIKFIDNSGKVIASSKTRKLYLHKASALIN